MCDVDTEAVVSCADASSIYAIPKVLHAEGLDAYVVRRLSVPFRDVNWSAWDDLLERVEYPRQSVTVGLVGKYIDLPDAYLSVMKTLGHAGVAHGRHVDMRLVDGEEIELRYDFDGEPFQRIRRITGYLVGTLDRFNNAKRAEERDRVKHSMEA